MSAITTLAGPTMQSHKFPCPYGSAATTRQFASWHLLASPSPAPTATFPLKHYGTAPQPQLRRPLRPSLARALAADAASNPSTAPPAALSAPSTLTAGWADGDVLRLRTPDGRCLHAEVLVQSPTQPRTQPGTQRPQTKQQQQQAGLGRRSQAAGAPPGGPHAAPQQQGQQGQVQVLCNGARYAVRPAEGTSPRAPGGDGSGGEPPLLLLEAVGGALPPSDPLLALLAAPPRQHASALRAWAPLVPRLLRPPAPTQQPQQQGPGVAGGSGAGAPSLPIAAVERLTTLAELRRRAAEEPGAWCDGTGPDDPPLSEDARALYTAGELACLLAGRRGVVLLQLHVGWDAAAGAPGGSTPPYGPYKPLVLRLLREALMRPDIVSYGSAAPSPPPAAGAAPGAAAAAGGNPASGLTLVLCGDKEPFRAWGAHLAGFGCQAALEAQSPYYKLLVGRVLGYLPHHVAHHIQSQHGAAPSPQVAAAVEQQLRQLSSRQPALPWCGGPGSRRKNK